MAGQPGRQASRGEPVPRPGARHDRRRTGRVGVGAGCRGHGHRAPWPVRGPPGARVHDVVQLRAATPPPAAADRRGRDRSHGQPDELGRVRGSGRVRLLGHGDRPAVPGRRPGDGDVTAQADQSAALVSGGGHDGPDGAVRAHALGRGAEIQPDTGRQPEQRPVEPQQLPARRGDRRAGRLAVLAARRLAAPADRREVAVVAERDERGADRRIGEPAGPPGRGQRHADRLGQPVAEHEQPAPGVVQPAQLRIRAEPAGLPVQRREHGIGGGARRAEVLRRPHHDPGAGAQRRAFGHGDGVVAGGTRYQGAARVSPAVPDVISRPGRPGRA